VSQSSPADTLETGARRGRPPGRKAGRVDSRRGIEADRGKLRPMPYYRCPDCGLTVHSAAVYSTVRVCPECAASLPGTARLHAPPGARRSIRQVLAARPDAAARARLAVAGLPVPEITRSDLRLLTSELVTNSVRHAGLTAGDPISVHIAIEADRVRLVVRDGGPGFTPPEYPSRDPRAAGGRGCVVVATLSDAWGVECDAHGCTVWCELGIHGRRHARPRTHQVVDSYVAGLVRGTRPLPAH
jgi:anti-sigma regulatory factor (Ser/Thr protein kinase)